MSGHTAFDKNLDEFSLAPPPVAPLKIHSRLGATIRLMDPHAFALLMLGVVAVSLGLSGYYFQTAFEQARPILPAPLQNEFAARFALDRFIWSSKAAAAARRSYLRSHVSACFAFFGMTALAANGDSAPVAVWLFAGVTLFALAVTLRACRRSRES